MKRLLNWFLYPLLIIPAAWKAIVPKQSSGEELAIFRELTPSQRWQKLEKQEWTADQLAKERTWSCYTAYALLFCAWMIFAAISFNFNYLTWFQVIGAVAYGIAALLFFAKKSMHVYAIDNKKIIFIRDWLLMPTAWIPVY